MAGCTASETIRIHGLNRRRVVAGWSLGRVGARWSLPDGRGSVLRRVGGAGKVGRIGRRACFTVRIGDDRVCDVVGHRGEGSRLGLDVPGLA